MARTRERACTRGPDRHYPKRKLTAKRISPAVCKALCEYRRDHSSASVKMLKAWLLNKHYVDVTIPRISQILDRSHLYLPDTVEVESEESGSSSSSDSEAREDDEHDDGPSSGTLPDPDEMEEDEQDDGSAVVTLSDPDVLDCPVCLDVLTIPVYQCENGHVACSSCCSRIQTKCPFCSQPIRHSRNLVIEKVLEAANVTCTYKKYGCKDVLKYGDKHAHDKICVFSPCACPESSCNFVSSSSKLYSHFSRCHGFSQDDLSLDQLISVTLERHQRYLVLGSKGKNIFILNNVSQTVGRAIKVIQIAPLCSTVKFVCVITAMYRKAVMILHSSVESVPKWCPDDHLGENFILVPRYFLASNGQLRLELRISSNLVLGV